MPGGAPSYDLDDEAASFDDDDDDDVGDDASAEEEEGVGVGVESGEEGAKKGAHTQTHTATEKRGGTSVGVVAPSHHQPLARERRRLLSDERGA